MGKLSPHFSKSEMQCKGCTNKKPCAFRDDFKIDDELLIGLELLRTLVGNRPIRINSAWRCKIHNRNIGSNDSSQHILGKAADIVIDGMTPGEVAKEAEKIRLFFNGGIGVYKTFTHLDVRKGRARWRG